MHERLKYLWYEVCYGIAAAGTSLAFSLRTCGARNVPRSGPLLVIANHQSFIDPVLVGVAVRRHLTALARKSLFKHAGLRELIESLGGVPVDQEGFAREGLKTVLEQLKQGRAVLVFPEGERTPDGVMHPLRPGIHLLIKRVELTILPVGIAGAYDAWPRWRPLPIPAPLFLPPGRGTVAVVIGRPIDSRRFAGQRREQVLAELFTELQKVHQEAERLRRR